MQNTDPYKSPENIDNQIPNERKPRVVWFALGTFLFAIFGYLIYDSYVSYVEHDKKLNDAARRAKIQIEKQKRLDRQSEKQAK